MAGRSVPGTRKDFDFLEHPILPSAFYHVEMHFYKHFSRELPGNFPGKLSGQEKQASGWGLYEAGAAPNGAANFPRKFAPPKSITNCV